MVPEKKGQPVSNTIARKKQSDVKIFIAIIALLVVGTAALSAYGIFTKRKTQPYQAGILKPYDDPANTKLLTTNSSEKLALVTIQVDKTGNATGVGRVDVYTGQLTPASNVEETNKLEIMNGDQVVYTTSFSIPPVVLEGSSEQAYPSEITVSVPAFPEGSKVVVKNSQNKAVATKDITGFESTTTNSTPGYYSIAGEDVPVE